MDRVQNGHLAHDVSADNLIFLSEENIPNHSITFFFGFEPEFKTSVYEYTNVLMQSSWELFICELLF